MIRRFIFLISFFGLMAMAACDKDEVSEETFITRGRELFNSEKFRCGQCHPNGDMDGKVWKLGFPPRAAADSVATPSLLGVRDTPPYLWLGEGGSDIRELTKVVIDSIVKETVTDEELDYLAAYQRSLVVPANPWRNSDGSLTESQRRGKSVFENQGRCINCHSGTAFTGQFKIQIRVNTPPIDVPSLRWIFATAPYFHDHKSLSLADVINYYADSVTTVQMTTWGWNARGIYDIELSAQERADLLEYLRSL
ncbi:c-type cytochrome [bacterium]|nr:c-type cytochrome [bacterium]